MEHKGRRQQKYLRHLKRRKARRAMLKRHPENGASFKINKEIKNREMLIRRRQEFAKKEQQRQEQEKHPTMFGKIKKLFRRKV